MKKFIVKLCLILCPVAVAICALTYVAYESELQILKRDLTCPTNIVAAVVGDSRVEVYFDPAEIPWMKNFGISAAPFSLTAQKARLVAQLNPSLKLLVIDVWPAKFFQGISRPIEAASAVPYGTALIEMMTRKDMPPLGDGVEIRIAQGVIRPGLRNILHGAENAHGQITGGFFKNKKSIPEELFNETCARKVGFAPPETPVDLPETPTGGEIILDHLLADLSKTDIKIVLTTTPLLWEKLRWTPAALEYFERRMTEIAARHKVPWYNWMRDYQNVREYWADGLHFNDIGAIVFSRDKRAVLERYIY